MIATADILEGDELCFSYGERSNDDFFVHYGFVPLRNPRDEVILFESIESALDWYAPQFSPQVSSAEQLAVCSGNCVFRPCVALFTGAIFLSSEVPEVPVCGVCYSQMLKAVCWPWRRCTMFSWTEYPN